MNTTITYTYMASRKETNADGCILAICARIQILLPHEEQNSSIFAIFILTILMLLVSCKSTH